MSATELNIRIVSDIACPWCLVGYRHLRAALDELQPDIEARISWQAFQLNPHIAAEGENLHEHIRHKYGSTETESRAMRRRITALGEETGFTFNFTDDFRTWNTFDAHRAMYWAGLKNSATAMAEQLFTAYFTNGENPGATATLLQAAQDAGLDAAELEQVLADDQYRGEVEQELAQARDLGISGVPTFIVNDQFSLTGAQPVSVFKDALQQIAREA
ncbi:DsbA family oxidoreductase [Natronospirillum operosum]|nr:DsbA family oxidoreductase [Natronospirillum operosum]